MSMGQVFIGVAAPWVEVALPQMKSRASYIRVNQTFDEILETATTHQNASSTRAPLPEAPASYQVKPGDTLSSIVRNHLKSMDLPVTPQSLHQGVMDVAKANNIANPNRIYPGQNLVISLQGAPAAVHSAAGSTHLIPNPPKIVVAPKVLTSPSSSPDPEDPIATAPPQGGESIKKSVVPPAIMAAPKPQESSPKEELSRMIEELISRRTQKKNVADSKNTTADPWSIPLRGRGRLSSRYGIRRDPFTRKMAFHSGIDIAARKGTPIHPYQAGEVVYSGWKSGYGNVVIVRHDNGLESVYGHTAGNRVKKGERVTPETVLAKVGSTGRSTGPHLHFEIRKNDRAVNPITYLKREHLTVAKNP